MIQWFVKDLSKITGVSVQTLHHYDRVDLLQPSMRLTNGYRVYSEQGLWRLQQIVALKFFGFELSKIKALLSGTASTLQHFVMQAQSLEQKAITLLEASKVLKGVVSDVKDDQPKSQAMVT
jgi:DNA-binding transcriptional MerR regulator